MAASKRIRSSPTRKTPRQPSKRSLNTSSFCEGPSSLFTPTAKWTDHEDKALVQFLLFTGNEWPTTKSTKLWEGASTFLYNLCGTRQTSELNEM